MTVVPELGEQCQMMVNAFDKGVKNNRDLTKRML